MQKRNRLEHASQRDMATNASAARAAKRPRSAAAGASGRDEGIKVDWGRYFEHRHYVQVPAARDGDDDGDSSAMQGVCVCVPPSGPWRQREARACARAAPWQRAGLSLHARAPASAPGLLGEGQAIISLHAPTRGRLRLASVPLGTPHARAAGRSGRQGVVSGAGCASHPPCIGRHISHGVSRCGALAATAAARGNLTVACAALLRAVHPARRCLGGRAALHCNGTGRNRRKQGGRRRGDEHFLRLRGRGWRGGSDGPSAAAAARWWYVECAMMLRARRACAPS